MLRYNVLVFVLLLVTFNGFVRGATDLSPHFQTLRDYVDEFPIDAEDKSAFQELINFAEEQASGETLNFTAVGELLDAILMQLASLSIEEQQAIGSQVAPLTETQQNGEDEEEVLDLFVDLIDTIKGTLFVEAGPIYRLPIPSTSTAPGSCNVAILARTVGPLLADPGGTFYTVYGNTIDLEAAADPEGGTFSWKLEPFDDKLYVSSNHRFSFRPLDRATFRVTVTYTGAQDQQCQDLLWIRVQGQFPEED